MKVQLVGIITTAVALLSWGFCISAQRVTSVGRAIVVLDRGHGIRVGTAVTYLGVAVGVVDRVALDDGRVIAELRIETKGATLRKGDRIEVQSHGIFGDKILDLVPGPRTDPLLGSTDTLFTVQPPEPRPETFLDALSRGLERSGTRADSTRRP